MAKLPKSPVPSLDGAECGTSFNDYVEVDVPYKGIGGASYKLPPITEMFIPLDDDDDQFQFENERKAHRYHRVLNDLRRAIDETEVTFSDLKKYINSANQSAIKGMIKNAQKAYDNAYDIAYKTEFRFPTLIEFEGPGGAGGSGVPGGWSPSDSGSGSWSAGSGSIGGSAGGGIKFGASGGIPDELIQRVRDGVYPLSNQRPTDIPSGQSPGFWPVYESDPPLLARASSALPDGRRAIYYGDLGWMVKVEGPMLDEQKAHDKAFAAYTRALYSGIKLIRCAQEAMTAVASQSRNTKSYKMKSLQQGEIKTPPKLSDNLKFSKIPDYEPEPEPSFPEPEFPSFSVDAEGEGGFEEPDQEKKKKSNSIALALALGAAALLVMRK
jgi:hypothetical protein